MQQEARMTEDLSRISGQAARLVWLHTVMSPVSAGRASTDSSAALFRTWACEAGAASH